MSKPNKTWSEDTADDDFPPMSSGRAPPRASGAGPVAAAQPVSSSKATPWAAKPVVAAVPLRDVMSQEPAPKPVEAHVAPPPRDEPRRDAYPNRDGGDRYANRDGGDRYANRDGGDRYANRDGGDRYANRDGGDRYADRPPREEVPIPDAPPFRVYVGKIPKETTEEDIGNMFAAMDLNCTNVIVIRHQDTQNARNAFATFGTRDELVRALEMNNQYPYDGAAMPIVVSPASAPPPGRDARQGGERRGGGGGFFGDRERFSGGDDKDWSKVRSGEQPTGGRDYRGGDRGDRDRPYGDRDRPYGDRPAMSGQRPQLNLQPRTAPIEAVPGQAAPSAKSNPFGDAKPITEEEREKRFLAAKAEREKALGAAPAAAKDEVPAPRREAPGPRRDDGRKEGSAFQSRKEGSSDRQIDGPWQRGVEQKPRAPRDGPAADPMSPGWNAAKPSGKRADRPAPQATAGAAGVQQPAKSDVKTSSNPFAALQSDTPTAEADE